MREHNEGNEGRWPFGFIASIAIAAVILVSAITCWVWIIKRIASGPEPVKPKSVLVAYFYERPDRTQGWGSSTLTCEGGVVNNAWLKLASYAIQTNNAFTHVVIVGVDNLDD